MPTPINQHTRDAYNYIAFGALLIPIVCYFMNGMVWATSLSAYATQHYFAVMITGVSFTYFFDYLRDRGSKYYNGIAFISLLGVAWFDMYNYPIAHYICAIVFFGNLHITLVTRVKETNRKIFRTIVAVILFGILAYGVIAKMNNPESLALHHAEWINMLPMAFLISGGVNKRSYYQIGKDFLNKYFKRKTK